MIPYTQLFHVFWRIGILSFGGPAAQISVMHKELVEDRQWLNEEAFLRALSFCMLLPGPEAMQLATYAGWKLRGVAGGLIAGLLFVLPGAFVIAGLVAVYAIYGDVPGVQAAFLGIKAAVIAIVLQALARLSQKTLKQPIDAILAGSAFVGIFAFNLPFPLIVLIAGLWGFWSSPTSGQTEVEQPAPTRWHAGLKTCLIWLPLWLGPVVFLTLTGQTFLADMGWFFVKLAVVTFGGAYAVLAYMSQTVVDQYGWISTGQMIDALGLAETTPGPLILVTQFVAMLAGYLNQGIALAITAGLLALWTTFVPCFLWIFLAAPHLERITSHARLSGALRAITAAVVGVILNLSVWFSINVLFENSTNVNAGPVTLSVPDWSSLNLTSALLTIASIVSLMVLKLRLEVVLLVMLLAAWLAHSI
ncbi:MAG: chromate efflux transporter [Rhodobacteraceae bacterium]|nr:chromate efflux transporter [Paracoccaceae bacterium]